LNFLVPEKEIR